MRAIVELVIELEKAGLSLWLDEGQIRYRGPPEVLESSTFTELKDRKTEVIDFLRSIGADRKLPPLGVQQRPEVIPASQSQAIAYALGHEHRLGPQRISIGFRVWTGLQADLRQQAVNWIADRHEILRTVFRPGANGLEQIILPRADVGVHVEDLTQFDRDKRRAMLFREILPQYRRGEIDVSDQPPLRLGLFSLNEDETFISLDGSRLTLDRASWQTIIREMTIYMRAVRSGTRPFARRPGLQFADFVLWEQKLLSELGDGAYDLSAATLEKGGYLDLARRDAPEAPPYARDWVSVSVPADLVIATKALSTQLGLPVSAIMSAAVLWLLGRLAGKERFVVGLQIPMRPRGLEEAVGPFSRLAPLPADLSGNPTFLDLVLRFVTANLVAKSPVNFVRADAIVQHKLNSVVMNFTTRSRIAERVSLDTADEGEETQASAPLGADANATPDFYNDLAITIIESETGMNVRFDFAPQRIEREFVRRMGSALPALMTHACADPAKALDAFHLEQAA